jgi:hypothetical protein
MDLRLTEYFVAFELEERRRAAERLHVQATLPVMSRMAGAAIVGFGHLLVRAGTRLEARERSLALVNPDPCGSCAN